MGAREGFIAAQERLFERVGLAAEPRFIEVPSVSGPAHVLVAGDGPPVVMVPGFGDPAATSAPLPLPMRLISIPPLGRFLMRLMPPSARQVEQLASMAGEDFSTLPEMRDLLVEMQKLPGARAPCASCSTRSPVSAARDPRSL
jgi:hypothetical protein